MSLVVSTLFNPLSQRLNLAFRQTLATGCRRHMQLRIHRQHTLHQRAVLRLASTNGASFAVNAVQPGLGIQTQIGLTFIAVRTVAEKTVV